MVIGKGYTFTSRKRKSAAKQILKKEIKPDVTPEDTSRSPREQ
jgi:hypothetical protein